MSPLLELGSELWGHGGVYELACVPYIHVAHDGLARAHLPSESHQRPSEESVKGNQGSSGVIGGHRGSSGIIIGQAIRRTNRPSAVRIPTARPDDASNSTRDTCVLSFSWQPACFVSPRTRALTMAAVPVGRARRRGEHVYSAARLVHDVAHDDAIAAHSAWKVKLDSKGD